MLEGQVRNLKDCTASIDYRREAIAIQDFDVETSNPPHLGEVRGVDAPSRANMTRVADSLP